MVGKGVEPCQNDLKVCACEFRSSSGADLDFLKGGTKLDRDILYVTIQTLEDTKLSHKALFVRFM